MRNLCKVSRVLARELAQCPSVIAFSPIVALAKVGAAAESSRQPISLLLSGMPCAGAKRLVHGAPSRPYFGKMQKIIVFA